ncbi:hypothetical protein CCMA1212_007255 [Trichoderma ghanense]|uniref:Uncharacterized protein n=1 Tax=Trichoderma ghanense TaxID=65468 RepID=A0ABY2GYL6_9HYPO
MWHSAPWQQSISSSSLLTRGAERVSIVVKQIREQGGRFGMESKAARSRGTWRDMTAMPQQLPRCSVLVMKRKQWPSLPLNSGGAG